MHVEANSHSAQSTRIQVAEADGCVIGVVKMALEDEVVALTKLFVDPASLRAGAGRKLFEWARTMAHAFGARLLTIDTDPGAANFYRRMGAVEDRAV